MNMHSYQPPPKSSRGKWGAQAGALCWRVRDDKIRVLMITSRTTRRWILPKGWIEDGLGARDIARQEAWEEAGVKGKLGKKPLGQYLYLKRDSRGGDDMPCRVKVHSLWVKDLAETWPEQDQRDRRWMSRRKAAAAVWEPDLAKLIRHFSPHGS